MCHFIIAVVSADRAEADVRDLAEQRQFSWLPIDNASIRSYLAEGESQFLTTRGMCDCGTEIGSARRERKLTPVDELDYTGQIGEFLKDGWSEAKINRWVEQKKAAAGRRIEQAAQRRRGPHPEIQRWIGFISEAIEQDSAKSIGLLLHWFSGNIESERIDVVERRDLPLSELNENCLLDVEEDVLNVFTFK